MGLLGTYLLFRDTKPGLDPLGSDNLLIFISSVIAGLEGVGLARFSVVTKSPLSGGIGETRCEGPWGGALKASGYDALVIQRAVGRPVYLLIEGGRASLQPAEGALGPRHGVRHRCIGKETWLSGSCGRDRACRRIAGALCQHCRGPPLPSHASGSWRCHGRQAAQSRRAGQVEACRAAADPKALAGITTLNASRLEGNDLTRWQKHPPGFAAWVDTITDPGYLSVENFRSGAPPDREAFASRRFLEFYRGEAPCPGCPNDCIKQFEAGGEAGSGGMHQEIAGALGPNVGLTDLATLVRANRYCNLQGHRPSFGRFLHQLRNGVLREGVAEQA